MLSQIRDDWGAIIVDDASDALSAEYLNMLAVRYRSRITLLQPKERRGQMANLCDAIRWVCTNPESIIITLDLDDSLIGSGVLARLSVEYDSAADATVGSMLRTDKHKPYDVDVVAPRIHRGGNVWQHLRTFRKRLFDAIPDHALRMKGNYLDIAVDWAFMLPVIEMAQKPVWIRDPLYLYET